MIDEVPQVARQGNVNDYSQNVSWLASAIASVVPGLTYVEV